MVDLIRFILSKDFEAPHFKKSEIFSFRPRNPSDRRRLVRAGTSSSRSSPARGAPAPWVRLRDRQAVAVRLQLLLNLVNDHPAGLVVRERLGVIAVAGMHPHA